ncbi:uncharacterized protein LOC110450818 isoform X2 [Mizuhopecten yessoensis]|uniref:uncharacterized protein LOC110450818 isoform X2 n=1 Tax=Mizuhopecten yessoensis TaxID=6573 RepID=UPI000B45E9AF|nr:uncharacterized protein LOC110450818 isoform X2 [Mizuhopecten yessoensis]
MVSNIQIESWVLMHACKYKYHHVIKGILNRHHDNLEELDVPKIYLSIAMIYNTVMTDNVLYYPVVVHHLDYIYSEVPDAVPFKLYSKLTMGLKMKASHGHGSTSPNVNIWCLASIICAMDLLKKNHDDALMVLNRYFPRKGSHYEHVIHRELSCLHSAQKNFRKFFLPLLAHQNQREAYFRDEYEDEYGQHYQEALQKLGAMFVEKLTSLLPPTVIEKILADGPEKYLPLSEGCTHLFMEMLLDTLHGKETLEEKDLLELLTMVSPLHTQDRVQVDKVWLLSSEESKKTSSKSLFSSDSDGHPKELERDNCLAEITDSAKTMDVNLTDSNQNQVVNRKCQETSTASKDDNMKRLRDSFGDFNDKRHLFHCATKDSQNRQISEKDSEHKKSCDSVESPKSSGESVSILRNKHPQMQTKTCSGDARLHDGEESTGNRDGGLPEQVHKVTSSSPNDSDPGRQVTLDSDNNTQKLTEENQTGSVIHIGTEAVTESDEEDVALEPWLSFTDNSNGLIGYSSESDIDQISEEEEDDVVPPSRMEDVEFWDIFTGGENNCSTTEPLAVPAIGAHAKHPDMKLCVVKLFRNEVILSKIFWT